MAPMAQHQRFIVIVGVEELDSRRAKSMQFLDFFD